jgi:hypothetical protein
MKQTVNFSTFQTAFESIRPDNFTYEGLTALFNWIEQQEQDNGEEQELDVIALCCDFTESTYEEIVKDYDLSDEEFSIPDEMPQAVIDYLNDETMIVGYNDKTVIYLNF